MPFADKVNLCQTIDAAARARDPRAADAVQDKLEQALTRLAALIAAQLGEK